MEPVMEAEDAVQILRLLNEHGIEVIIDGGWGVDALLGRQTRRHEDLDIAMDHSNVLKIRSVLEFHGYRDVPRNDSHTYNFVMGDDNGHLIDIHTFHFDESGKLVEGLDYPFESLGGSGSIKDFPVRCITPEWMVKFHTGYKVDENDFRDVKALCDIFDIPLPVEYDSFNSK